MIVVPASLYHGATRERPEAVPARIKVVVKRAQSGAITTATVNADYIVADPNFALILRAAVVETAPSGGENRVDQSLRIVSPSTDTSRVNVNLAADDVAGAANAKGTINWSGEIIVMPGWVVRGQLTKNAGVQTATSQLDLFGFLIPVGDLQLA